MTKITYLERPRENDHFHNVLGMAEYISSAMKAQFAPEEEAALEESHLDERDDNGSDRILLSKNSSGDLAFNSGLVYNLNHPEVVSRDHDEEKRDIVIEQPQMNQTSTVQVPHKDNPNGAPIDVYTGMSKKLKDLLREDNDDKVTDKNSLGRDPPPPSNSTFSNKIYPINTVSNSTPHGFAMSTRKSNQPELASNVESKARVVSSMGKRSPQKYSVSKITQATSGPVPKADDFFDELKKWHKNYALRDVEKPRQITIYTPNPPRVDTAKEESEAVEVEAEDSDHFETSEHNRQSKEKKTFWGRIKGKSKDANSNDSGEGNEQAIELTQNNSVNKRIQKKALKAKKAEMKKAKKLQREEKKGTLKDKKEKEKDIAMNTSNTKSDVDRTKQNGESAVKDNEDPVHVEDVAKKKKTWSLKIPLISKKKNKIRSVGVNTKDAEEESLSYPTLGIAQTPTKKPLKDGNTPSFETTLKKFLKLEAGIFDDQQHTADAETDGQFSSNDAKAIETLAVKQVEEPIVTKTAQSNRCAVTDASGDCGTQQMNELMQQIINVGRARLNALEGVGANTKEENISSEHNNLTAKDNTKETETDSGSEEYDIPVCPCPSGELLDYGNTTEGSEAEPTRELKQSESWLEKASKIFHNLTQTETTTETDKLEVILEENESGIEMKVEGNGPSPGSSWDPLEQEEAKVYSDPLNSILDEDNAPEKANEDSKSLVLPLVAHTGSLFDADSDDNITETESVPAKPQKMSPVISRSTDDKILSDDLTTLSAKSNSIATEACAEGMDASSLLSAGTEEHLPKESPSQTDTEHYIHASQENLLMAKAKSEGAGADFVGSSTAAASAIAVAAAAAAAADQYSNESSSCVDSKSNGVEPSDEDDEIDVSRDPSVAASNSGSLCVSVPPTSESKSCADSTGHTSSKQGSIRNESATGPIVLSNQSTNQDAVDKKANKGGAKNSISLFGKERNQSAKKESNKKDKAIATPFSVGLPQDAATHPPESTKRSKPADQAATLFISSPRSTKSGKKKSKNNTKKQSNGAQAATLFGKQQENNAERAKRKKEHDKKAKCAPTLF
mmetsp:Transcript_20811/g.57815  ORF Transcript_20811/g.57815 Transcript_20811/m.57815 type:complete len:1073 (+) Transcript_20811:106-3324(+)|eukprot:CAMPEP_0172377172 /NCGR_PEP_ID=MMETSP1060-20121228/68761_1 /TAXON_ID=37318 /ORGANISM="Pseudo-nitzschia pungens, Strain cf. cingulata" /LENGTH=1072 /DNA_ID=CAMNT_0013104843 /DNA_START=36 /DNA_END=3254 /DNA_ORIENTATION=-